MSDYKKCINCMNDECHCDCEKEELKKVVGVLDIGEPIRTYDYEVAYGAVGAEDTYPTKFTIGEYMYGAVKDQGTVGACAACVIATICEVFDRVERCIDAHPECRDNRELLEKYLDEIEIKEYSEGFIYGALRDKDSRGYGMIVTVALKLWLQYGGVPKNIFDLLFEMPEMKEEIEKYPELLEIAKNSRISSYVVINAGGSKTGGKRDLQIKDALTKVKKDKNKALLAVSNNYFSEPHCIYLTGWDDEKDAYEFKNSWGPNYGKEGISYIPKSEINVAYLVSDEELELPFSDVPKEHWAFKHIKNQYYSGRISGYPDGTFKPDAYITRAEACAMNDRTDKKIDERFIIMNKIINTLFEIKVK